MNDRELLEAAARAAGIELDWLYGWRGDDKWEPWLGGKVWEPLTDDGDALRLAIKLRLEIQPVDDDGVDIVRFTLDEPFGELLAHEGGADQYAATRRAIVRAAAALAPTGEVKEE
jgi:hypothetical protein